MHEHRSCFSLDLHLLTKQMLIRKYRFRCFALQLQMLGRAMSQLLFTNTPSNRKKVHLAQCTISKAHGQHAVFSNESKTPFQLKFVHKWISLCFPFFPQQKSYSFILISLHVFPRSSTPHSQLIYEHWVYQLSHSQFFPVNRPYKKTVNDNKMAHKIQLLCMACLICVHILINLCPRNDFFLGIR